MSGNLGAPDEVVLREYDPPKAAQPSATFSGSYHHKIAFRHPGYRDEFEQNVLLTLYAFDNHSRALHHATAHTVCALVACNAWDGYFTRTRDGERLQLTADGLLTEKEYYFHVPGNTRYPVYPTFSSWKFPKDNLPPHWPEEIQDDGEDGGGLVAPPSVSGVTKAVITRDRGCVISKDQDYVEKAHLCPQSEAEWFRINGMGDYNLNDTLADEVITDDISNAIGLRPDIHKAFDDRRFVIVRKHGQWVVHFINLTQNLGRRYHNIPLKLQTGVSARCLLIRFAWAIFPSVKKFLTRGASHAVRIRVQEDSEEGVSGFTEKTTEMSRDEALKLGGGGRSRSVSPEGKGKKRKVDEDAEEQADSGSLLLYTIKRRRIDSPISRIPSANVSSSLIPSSPKLLYLHTPPDSQKQHKPPETVEAPSAGTTYRSPNPYAGIAEKLAEKERLDKLRISWIRCQRPSNPDLICCDYNAASAAYKAGIQGRAKWGGSHLCEKCLGVEYAEDRDDDEDLPPWDNGE
ncbi:hypothetical protein H2201_008950 [Coniosporium apollinis]|uniref:HNH nuclease domain-containing protein n=1 Tax=Coniosporium apollinis TaxID=61459 RepID=A0ABQ9NF09_9PEZI|nr:hypothetical protein H2201_008950 [Coniosporium apollinis]